IAFGSVGPRVFRSREMEKKMIGLSLDQLKGNMEAILGDYGKILSPISDVRSTRDYRRDVSLNILKDMIERGLMP
ncbi:MAG: hypothetical protein NUK57_08145, partial [Gudongella sp.]|nr:hypothetical protein [Gudongella sp.]